MINLAAAFTIAWKDLKAFGTKAESWITKQAKVVDTVTQTVGAVVSTVDPALAPVVSTFDTLEEVVIGKLAALASDVSTAASVQALVGDAWPTIQSLVTTLKSHPAVTTATAATSTPAAPTVAPTVAP